ncbi:hypothetical protein [Geothermobacter hydrogeniphilus]|uniref:hypothetical protein n=1 Tax=Geothermobacter hydrogeniphilus TaxID=1969733 RepID=UPI0011AEE8F3|nr:hypothetical protein [Geothermobacter hydrogeniphilus]
MAKFIFVIAVVMLAGCGGGGDSVSTTSTGQGLFNQVTVSEVNSYLSNNGLVGSNTSIVHEDGFGNGGDQIDIGRVILTRINGGYFVNDIGYAFDLKYIGNLSSYPSGVTKVLYLDVDNNINTGMVINGIGADVRLTDSGPNNTLTSGYCEWDSTNSSWTEVFSGSNGSADDAKYVDGGAHVYVGVYGTSSLLNSDGMGVVTLEILTNDSSGTAYRYDATSSFSIAAF